MHPVSKCESAEDLRSLQVSCRLNGGPSTISTTQFACWGRLRKFLTYSSLTLPVCVLSLLGMLAVTPPAAGQEKPGNPKLATTPVLPTDHVYQSISARGRLRWFVKSTIGLESLSGGLISAAWGTGFDNPQSTVPGGKASVNGTACASPASRRAMHGGWGRSAVGRGPSLFPRGRSAVRRQSKEHHPVHVCGVSG